MRIVVYAEGAAESSAGLGLAPTTCEPLAEHQLGAAHILVARLIGRDTQVPEEAVRFLAPLRVGGRIAVGSDLHVKRTLRRLLSWPDASRRPDFAVVIVDDDGKDRRKDLQGSVDGVSVEPVVAVAVQEFEAWLIADASAVPGTEDLPAHPENLRPGEAKHGLAQRLASSGVCDQAGILQARVHIARSAELPLLERLRSFHTFQSELRALAKRLGQGGSA